MNSSLLKLIQLRVRAGGRRILRGLKTPRGALLSLVGCGMFALWIGPAFLVGLAHERIIDPEATRAVVPMFLLMMCVWTVINSSGEKAIYFSPAEVNFLLGGPFQRQELLAYKLLFTVLGAALSALIFAGILLVHFQSWLAAYIGIFLALVLIQLVGMSCLMVAQTIGERAYSHARKLLLVLALALAALAVERALHATGSGGVAETMRHVRESAAGRILLAVFDVYGRAMTAESLYPELLVWGGLALAINCALVALVMLLDADYIEASVVQSQKQYERLQRMRRGGVAGWSGRATKRGRLPPFPWLGGAGPIAWRQLLSALRSSRGMLILLVILAVVGCPMLLAGRSDRSLIPVVGMLVWTSVFLTQRITFDFRGDLDRIDSLKSLPLRSTAITLGELVTPVLVMTGLQVPIVVAAVIWVGSTPPFFVLSALALLPFNLIVFEIDNLLFLLFPSRQMTGQPTDFMFFGRTMLMLFAKVALLAIAAVLAVGAGFVVYAILGEEWIGVIGAGAGVLTVIAIGLVPCVAWAFRRFDVSTETPP